MTTLLSHWAYQNPKAARLYLVLLNTLLGILGFLFGLMIYTQEIILPKLPIWSLIAFIFLLNFIYPFRKQIHFTAIRQKLDGFIYLTAFLLYIVVGNHTLLQIAKPEYLKGNDISVQFIKSSIPLEKTSASVANLQIENHSPRPAERILGWKVSFKHFLQGIAHKMEGIPVGFKVSLYILAFLASLVICYFLALFSCSLGCSGYGIAAVLLLLGGTLLLTLALVGLARILFKGMTLGTWGKIGVMTPMIILGLIWSFFTGLLLGGVSQVLAIVIAIILGAGTSAGLYFWNKKWL